MDILPTFTTLWHLNNRKFICSKLDLNLYHLNDNLKKILLTFTTSAVVFNGKVCEWGISLWGKLYFHICEWVHWLIVMVKTAVYIHNIYHILIYLYLDLGHLNELSEMENNGFTLKETWLYSILDCSHSSKFGKNSSNVFKTDQHEMKWNITLPQFPALQWMKGTVTSAALILSHMHIVPLCCHTCIYVSLYCHTCIYVSLYCIYMS